MNGVEDYFLDEREIKEGIAKGFAITHEEEEPVVLVLDSEREEIQEIEEILLERIEEDIPLEEEVESPVLDDRSDFVSIFDASNAIQYTHKQ